MPECISCGETYSERRALLGYNTCLPCGDFAARQVQFCVVNVHKSNYTVVSIREELKGLNKYAST